MLVLFALVTCTQTPSGNEPEDIKAAIPPTWGAMPTRLPTMTPTSVAAAPLKAMQDAILAGDLDKAQAAWDQAYALCPDDEIVTREGVRISLAQKDYATAEIRAWQTISLSPKNPEAWSLLGTVLARQQANKAADQAFSVAQALNTDLANDVYADRWRAARRAGDSDMMLALAQAHSSEQPEDPLSFYYRAAALNAAGDPDTAIQLMVANLKANPESPGVLWAALGKAYLARGAWSEAIIALETATTALARGDRSLRLISEDPFYDLNLDLAKAYLGGEQCGKAEVIFRRLSTPVPELAPFVEQAILCQTPTPTWTPWIPSQQPTMTPTP